MSSSKWLAQPNCAKSAPLGKNLTEEATLAGTDLPEETTASPGVPHIAAALQTTTATIAGSSFKAFLADIS